MAAYRLNDAHLPEPWQAPCGRWQICRHAIGQGVFMVPVCILGVGSELRWGTSLRPRPIAKLSSHFPPGNFIMQSKSQKETKRKSDKKWLECDSNARLFRELNAQHIVVWKERNLESSAAAQILIFWIL